MKNLPNPIVLLLTLLLAPSFPAAAARNVFKVSWHGTAYTRNESGQVVARPYSQRDIINRYATATGEDPKTLFVAYVWDEEEPAEEIEIVRADGSTVANVFQFLGGLAVSNSEGTSTKRQRFLFDEDHGSALGNISGSEKMRRRTDGEVGAFAYSGRFEFNIPEENTVYIGSFVTGKRLE
jgi:hypothetical protein